MKRKLFVPVLFLSVLFISTSDLKAATDHPNTVAHWSMESITQFSGTGVTRNVVPDNDLSNKNRNCHLILGDSANTAGTEPVLSAAGQGYDGTGMSLVFDGIDDTGYSATDWQAWDNVIVDVWFNTTKESGTQIICEVSSTWSLGLGDKNASFSVTNAAVTGGDTLVIPFSDGNGSGLNQWHHLVASFDSNSSSGTGVMKLNLNGNVVTKQVPWTLRQQAHTMTVGNKPGTSRYFSGKLDELQISRPQNVFTYETGIHKDSWGVKGLWHFNEISQALSYNSAPDDDVNNPGRDSDYLLYELWTPVASGGSGGPTVVDPGTIAGVGYPNQDPNFGKCIYLDGENDSLRTSNAHNVIIDPNNFRFEAWIRLDDSVQAYNDNMQYWLFNRRAQINFYVNETVGVPMGIGYDLVSGGVTTSARATYAQMGLDYHQWHHVALTVIGNKASLQVNGVEWASSTLNASSLTPAHGENITYMGCRYGSNGKFFWGYIDEARVSQAVPTKAPCGWKGYPEVDLNKDCVVDLKDMGMFAGEWLTDAESGPIFETANFNIPQSSAIPVIDGVISSGEWDDAKVKTIVYPNNVTAPQAGIATGNAAEMLPSDISAYCYYKWDSTYLYVGLKIVDDIFIAPAPGSGYPNDHVLFAFNPVLTNTAWDNTLTFEMFRNSNNLAETKIYKNGFNSLTLSDCLFAASTSSGYWSYEAALKWTSITGNTAYIPAANNAYGIGVLLCDNDAADSTRDVMLADVGSMEMPSVYNKATLTTALACGDNGYKLGDVNKDCDINFDDFADIAKDWMGCTLPDAEECP